MKYAHYNNEGTIVGFYDSDIHIDSEGNLDIPEPNLQITDEQWQDCLAHQGLRKIEDNAVVEYTPPPPPLDELKEQARERLRLETQQHITGGFTSSALGTPHDYQSALTDQSTLQSYMLQALQPDIDEDTTWATGCRDVATDTAALRPHTIAQLRRLADDMAQHIASAQALHQAALVRLDDATTNEEVAAVKLTFE